VSIRSKLKVEMVKETAKDLPVFFDPKMIGTLSDRALHCLLGIVVEEAPSHLERASVLQLQRLLRAYADDAASVDRKLLTKSAPKLLLLEAVRAAVARSDGFARKV
jgi:hypothetical protein